MNGVAKGERYGNVTHKWQLYSVLVRDGFLIYCLRKPLACWFFILGLVPPFLYVIVCSNFLNFCSLMKNLKCLYDLLIKDPLPEERGDKRENNVVAYELLIKLCRYSIWLDSKLRLQLDPLLILEYFLWRKGYEYAISNHYDRHCVWEEVAQNKKLNKYNHTVIDEQFAFYQADGLQRFNASDPNKLLHSSMFYSSIFNFVQYLSSLSNHWHNIITCF